MKAGEFRLPHFVIESFKAGLVLFKVLLHTPYILHIVPNQISEKIIFVILDIINKLILIKNFAPFFGRKD